MAEKKKPQLLLISPAVPPAMPGQVSEDREGAEEQGKIKDAVVALVGRATKIKPVDAEKFADRLSESIADTAKAVQGKILKTFGEFTVDEVAISLAITAEGDIGIASAGMEASIEVTLKRQDKRRMRH
jgi:hypothetical protein